MSLTINLTPAEEKRLKAAAKERGIAPQQMAEELVREHLPAGDPIADMNRRIAKWQREDRTPQPYGTPSHIVGLLPTAALFAQWEQEDARMTDEDIAADDLLWSDFRQGIDEARTAAGMRTLF